MLSVCAGHAARLDGLTGCEQQTPVVVTLAGAQHAPLDVGMRPEAQQSGPIGMRRIGRHSFLLALLGACPAGQQTPVEVTLLARQHVPPVCTYPFGQGHSAVAAPPGGHWGGFGGWHWPLTSGPLQQAGAPPEPAYTWLASQQVLLGPIAVCPAGQVEF